MLRLPVQPIRQHCLSVGFQALHHAPSAAATTRADEIKIGIWRNFSVRRLDAMDPGILENSNMDFGTNMRRLTGSLGGLGANKTHTAFSVLISSDFFVHATERGREGRLSSPRREVGGGERWFIARPSVGRLFLYLKQVCQRDARALDSS